MAALLAVLAALGTLPAASGPRAKVAGSGVADSQEDSRADGAGMAVAPGTGYRVRDATDNPSPRTPVPTARNNSQGRLEGPSQVLVHPLFCDRRSMLRRSGPLPSP